MSGGKKQSAPKILKEIVRDENFFTRAFTDLWDRYFAKDNQYLNYIDENGIKWTSLEKNLNQRNIENHDYAIAEVKGLYGNIQDIDEILAHCRYKGVTFYEYLWELYSKEKSNDKVIECEKSIKDVLYITAILKTKYETEREEFTKDVQIKTYNNTREIKDDLRRLEQKMDVQIIQNKRSEQNTYGEKGKEIKIYLAASQNECGDYIEALKCFIDTWNTSNKKGVHISLYQGESNFGEEIIRSCDYYHVIVKTVAEDWMKRSYEIARNQYCSTEFPVVHFWVKSLSGLELQQAHKTRIAFRDRYIDDFGTAPNEFKNIDTIKLSIIMSIACNDLRVEENCIRASRDICFSLDSIPDFRNSETLCREKGKQDALKDRYDSLCEDYYKDSNPETYKKLENAKKELEIQRTKVSRIKENILEYMIMMADKGQNREKIDRREREAIDCIKKHKDYDRAIFTLDSQEWKLDIDACTQKVKNNKEEESSKVVEYISGQKMLISILKMKGITGESETKIINIYKDITKRSEIWQMEYDTLYEFAEFLFYQRRYPEGINQAERLRKIDELYDIISSEDKVKMFDLLGQLYYWNTGYAQAEVYYEQAIKIMEEESLTVAFTQQKLETDLRLAQLFWKTNQFEKADKKFKDILDIIEPMAQEEPENYQQILSDTYNYLGIISNKRKQFHIALEYYHKALKVRERLVEQNLSDRKGELRNLFNTYNNLGVIYKKLGNYQKSIEYHEKSIHICQRKVRENPSVYRPSIAMGYTNLAIVLCMNGETERALELCQEALDIRRKLESADSSYRAVVAKTLCEYGVIWGYANNYPKAEECFQEAIRINKKLVEADKTRTAHEPTLAKAYFHYGSLLIAKGKGRVEESNDEAEEYLNMALEVFRRFEKSNPGYYAFEMAKTCEALATVLCQSQKKRFQAEAFCRESIQYWNLLAGKCQQVFGPKYENAKKLLAQLTDNASATALNANEIPAE